MRHAVLLTLLLLAGCANPYSKFYRPNANPYLAKAAIPSSAPLTIYSTNDFQRDVDALMRKGYTVIGRSAFNAASNSVSERQLRAQAADVHAEIVLVSSRFTHTITGAIPLVTPTTSTSYTSGTATANGPGGTVTAYGNATTTTYGTQTTMMPYTIARSDFEAVYFAKARQRTGMLMAPLDDATRKRIGTNAGVLVRLLVDGSPAFDADILPGDILLSMADNRVVSVEQYTQLLDRYEGQTVTFHFDRDGQGIDKTFRVNSYQDPLK